MWIRAGAHIVSDSIDGEVIIVNLIKGIYFSISGSGERIWDCISNGWSIENVAEYLRTEFVNVPDDVTDKITTFAEKLEDEGLIKRSDDRPPANEKLTVNASTNGARLTFEEPSLTVFTDMEALLLLDPVHDFDEAGWPNQVPSTVTSD